MKNLPPFTPPTAAVGLSNASLIQALEQATLTGAYNQADLSARLSQGGATSEDVGSNPISEFSSRYECQADT